MKSMTGFGGAEGKVGKGTVFVEIRAVNHRYVDLQFKIPPKFNVLDPRIRKVIQSRIARGKVDLFMKEKREIVPTPIVRPNRELALAYQRCLKALARQLRGATPHLLEVVNLRDLVEVSEPMVRYERYWRPIGAILQRALGQLERMRRTEGAHLKRDQMRRVALLEQLVRQVGKRAVELRRLGPLVKGQISLTPSPLPLAPQENATRPAAEITEELTRLQSHIRQYRRYTTQTGPIGRQLDFLLQEMNREINTIGSKGNDATISQRVVDAKSELEKLREQVQNIE